MELLAPVVRRNFWLVALALACALTPLRAQSANEARVTRVSKEVKLVTAGGGSHSATLNARVPAGTTVRTGVEAQTELKWNDNSVARLAGKTAFSFGPGSRQMELASGAMLVRVPGSTAGAEIRADAATVVVTGTTCLLEHNAGKYVKLVVLDGTARMYLKARLGESVLVKEGQLLMFHLGPKLTALPNPVDVDIKRLMATSKLIHGFPPIGSEASINQRIADQKQEKTKGALVDTNLVIYGRGTMVSLVDGESTPPNTSPTPTPSAAKRHSAPRP